MRHYKSRRITTKFSIFAKGKGTTFYQLSNSTKKMEKETISKLNKTFEECAYEQDGIEYWLARELQELLGYADWRNFLNAVEKAKISCKNASEAITDHFVDVNKMVKIGSGAELLSDWDLAQKGEELFKIEPLK